VDRWLFACWQCELLELRGLHTAIGHFYLRWIRKETEFLNWYLTEELNDADKKWIWRGLYSNHIWVSHDQNSKFLSSIFIILIHYAFVFLYSFLFSLNFYLHFIPSKCFQFNSMFFFVLAN
jgi:hypothetical protein